METDDIMDDQSIIAPPENSEPDSWMVRTPLGKKIGLAAFIITEIVIVFALVMTWYDYHADKLFDTNSLTNIVFYQLLTLTITWGSKASANLAEAWKGKK
jgi:hypothetical protein